MSNTPSEKTSVTFPTEQTSLEATLPTEQTSLEATLPTEQTLQKTNSNKNDEKKKHSMDQIEDEMIDVEMQIQ
ncbi:825_t:CDS:1, partial [Scutellospora calospora]